MDIHFSEITESDLGNVTLVMTRAFDDDAQKHLGQPKGGPPGYDNGDFFREWLFGQEASIGYKATIGDNIVGATIVWILETRENFLGTIFVDPDYQDIGVGSRIWEFVETSYPDTLSWQLETPSYATKNHHFYEKCGFQRIGIEPAKEGEPWDTWVYRKVMTPMETR